MRIAIIGATGSVGAAVVDGLLAQGVEVHAIGRRATGRVHGGFREHVAPVADWPALAGAIGADGAVSALGATMKTAGTEAGFRAVDHEMVLAFAAAARDAGARRMLTVSSAGADRRSRNFYLSLKGEVEHDLAALGFDRLDLLRPGLLVGERGRDRKLAERIAISLSPVMNLILRGPLDRFASIKAATVARAAVACLMTDAPGVHIHDNRALRALAE